MKVIFPSHSAYRDFGTSLNFEPYLMPIALNRPNFQRKLVPSKQHFKKKSLKNVDLFLVILGFEGLFVRWLAIELSAEYHQLFIARITLKALLEKNNKFLTSAEKMVI